MLGFFHFLIFFCMVKDFVDCTISKATCPTFEERQNFDITCDFDQNTTNIIWSIVSGTQEFKVATCTAQSCTIFNPPTLPEDVQISDNTVSPESNACKNQLKIWKVKGATAVFGCTGNSTVENTQCKICTNYTLPTAKLDSSCPNGPNDFIKEGQNVTCKCGVQNTGSPPGYVQWFDSSERVTGHTSRLERTATVEVSYGMKTNGLHYTCKGVSTEGKESVGVMFTPKFGEQATVTSFEANTIPGSLEVSEGTKVTLTCNVQGIPSPNITIAQNTTGISHTTTGQITNYLTLDGARCEHTGVFTCNTYNYGVPHVSNSQKSLTLYVKCTPMLQKQEDENRTIISTTGNKAFLSLAIQSYPPPTSFKLFMKRSASIFAFWPNRYTVRYELDSHPFGYVNLAMDRLEPADFLPYILTISNGVGAELNYDFRIEPNLDSSTSSDDNNNLLMSAVIGVCSSLGVLLIAFVIGCLVYMRRRRLDPNSLNSKPKIYHSTDGNKTPANNYDPVTQSGVPFYEEATGTSSALDPATGPKVQDEETSFYESMKDSREAALQNEVKLPTRISKEGKQNKKKGGQKHAPEPKKSSREEDAYETFGKGAEEETYVNFS